LILNPKIGHLRRAVSRWMSHPAQIINLLLELKERSAYPTS